MFHDNESDFLEQSCTNSLASLNRVYEFIGIVEQSVRIHWPRTSANREVRSGRSRWTCRRGCGVGRSSLRRTADFAVAANLTIQVGVWNADLRQDRRENFLLQSQLCVLTSCLVSVPPPPSVLPQWHVKDPGHCAKSAGGKLQLNTHTPLTQRSRSGRTMPLPGHSMGTYPETRSHATCLGTFDHSRLSSLSHCGLILS